MDLLITYDVNTTTKEGKRRLRTVAKICEGYGQRVQNSVFEVVLTETQLVVLRGQLMSVVSGLDSIRLYRMEGLTLDRVETLGHPSAVSHRDAWVL